jgi:hypothetical protein
LPPLQLAGFLEKGCHFSLDILGDEIADTRVVNLRAWYTTKHVILSQHIPCAIMQQEFP